MLRQVIFGADITPPLVLFIIIVDWLAQLRTSQLETLGLICSVLGVYFKKELLKNPGSIVPLCSDVLKMFCFALMETWNLMKWLTLVLELCLSVVSMKNHLNCVKVEAIVYLQLLLKAALTAEFCSWISGGCQINVWYFFIWFYSAVACRDVGSKEKMGAGKIIKYVWPINIWVDWVLLRMTLCIGDAEGVERWCLSWHISASVTMNSSTSVFGS